MERVSELTVLNEIEVAYVPKDLGFAFEKISHSQDSYEILRECYDPNTISYRESAYVLYLNRSNKPIGVFHLSTGGCSGTVMDVKQILGIALKTNASALILSHNHPSGNLSPSQADLKLTSRIKEACEMMSLALLDHVIISTTGYYSMADECDL